MKAKILGAPWIRHKTDSSSGGYSCNNLIEWNDNEYDFEIYVDKAIPIGNNSSFKNKVAWVLESKQVIPDVIDYLIKNKDELRQIYKFIFTCQDSLLNLGEPFTYTISNAGPYIIDKRIYNKNKLISMIASTKDFTLGHQKRLKWVERLENLVDLYGRGRKHQLNCKEEGLVDYMFSVAIENDDSDAYFTQTLTDCFATGTIPIFCGSKKVIDKYFDKDGVIFLESEDQIKKLTQTDYYDRIKNIKNNLEVVKDLISSEDYFVKTYLI